MKKNAALVRARRFAKSTRGANLVEYIILVGVVSVLCLGIFMQFGGLVRSKIEGQKTAIDVVPAQTQN